MPTIQLNQTCLHYDIAGDGDETIVLVHGLMLASDSWVAQRNVLAERYRVITFDLRGQGRSAHPRAGLDLDTLAEDTAALIRELAPDGCHLVGFSMGSFIAIRVAARHPALVLTLTLIGPSAEAEELANWPKYALMIGFVSLFGPRLLAPRMMEILFGRTFLSAANRDDERRHWHGIVAGLPRSMARAAFASARRRPVTRELSSISAPTLIVSGSEDKPIHPAHARAVHDGIAGSQFVLFEQTGHAVMIEQPARFNALLINHVSAAIPRPS